MVKFIEVTEHTPALVARSSCFPENMGVN